MKHMSRCCLCIRVCMVQVYVCMQVCMCAGMCMCVCVCVCIPAAQHSTNTVSSDHHRHREHTSCNHAQHGRLKSGWLSSQTPQSPTKKNQELAQQPCRARRSCECASTVLAATHAQRCASPNVQLHCRQASLSQTLKERDCTGIFWYASAKMTPHAALSSLAQLGH
ncbi:hypothetical protein COO60DRAFT_460093 [Scenedesmus sp. NREL 46B-D3]|nr:hypothetical protein COO60DRAFT_460093 [Scenedesmus sp. NREL 46B-D3]